MFDPHCVRRTRRRLSLAMGLLAMLASAASAQLPQTRLYAIFPPGAKAGTSVDVQLTGGADLDEIDSVYFDEAGIRAEPKKDANGNPVGGNQFSVTVDTGVAPGIYEMRAGGLFGVSNPRSFVVGQQDESREAEPNNEVGNATELKLGVVANGQINGGADVDFYRLDAQAGQRIVIDCHAVRIDSRLIAVLSLFDANGRRLAVARNTVGGDPLIDIEIPADGSYFVKVHDYVYRGSTEYAYRLEAHTRPHIDFVIPPAGVAGSNSKFTLFGRNLPGGKDAGITLDGRPLQTLDVNIALPSDPTALQLAEHLKPWSAAIDGVSYRFQGSNPVMLQLSSAPVVREQEPNNEAAQANKITVPGEFAGQFQAQDDIDYVSFDAKAGQVLYIEVFGQRNGTTADPYFVLDQVTKNEKGEETGVKRLTAQDDNGNNPGGLEFNTTTSDPVFRFQVPQDGTYRIAVNDRYFESRGDPRLVYRLAIRKESPDYRLTALAATPPPANNQPGGTSSLMLRKGDHRSIKVMAFRNDGFDARIDLRVEGLPEGVTCRGASIGPGQNSAVLVFASADNAAEGYRRIRIVGSSTIDNPDRARAADAAKKAIKPAKDELAKLVDAEAKAAAPVGPATEKRDAAKKASDEKPDDDGLKNQLAAAEQALAQANDAHNKAKAATEAGRQKLATAEAAYDAADNQRKAAARQVTRVARSATVVWTGNATAPSIARTARSIGVSVIKDVAHFQPTTDVFEIEVNQNRQVLIPVKLVKREGFDNNVAFTFVSQPKNVDIQNKPINKGSDSEVFRMFVKNNAPEGTYTLYLKGAGQIQYRRNPWKIDREKVSQTAAAEAFTKADEAFKKATQERDAANKAATDAQNALNTANSAKNQAQQKLTQANQQHTQAAQAKQKTDKAASDADAAAKQAAAKADEMNKAAAAELATAQKALSEAQAAAKVATDKATEAAKAVEADKENKELVDAKTAADKVAADAAAKLKQTTDAQTAAQNKANTTKAAAQKLVNDANQKLKQATAAKAAADKKFTDTQNAQKLAQQTFDDSEKKRIASEATLKAANDEKTKKETAFKAAEGARKTAEAAKKAADKRVTDAENAAKPKGINITSPTTPIVLTIKKGPATITASVPNGGALKRGQKIEIKTTVKRINDFVGPVTLTLPLPPGVTGLKAAPVTIAADQTEGMLVVEAAGDATEGQLANMVIRANMEFDGKAAVDAPITLKVDK